MSGLRGETVDAPALHAEVAHKPARGWYTTSQVARILGVAEASVKRLADSGAIACTRSPAHKKRFFTSQQIVDHLRAGRASPCRGLSEALRSGDQDEFVAQVIDLLERGGHLEDVLDDTLGRAGPSIEAGFANEVLLRLLGLVAQGRDSGRPALVARIGNTATEARMVECVLRAMGYDALSASESVEANELANMALRVGAELVVFVVANCPAPMLGPVLRVGAALATVLREGSVFVVGGGALEVPQGVVRVTTMAELGRFLRGGG